MLEELKPLAQSQGWLWTGNDLSESISLTEERLARRIVVDLSALLSPMLIKQEQLPAFGFQSPPSTMQRPIDFHDLWNIYEKTAGLTIDKLKAVLISVWGLIDSAKLSNGVVFAYDEAQNMADHAQHNEYPLSLLIDLFSSLQRSTPCRYLLVLTGLPTLYPKLNEARTYTERMFHIMHLKRLSDDESREAIAEPIRITNSPLTFSGAAIDTIVKMSAGYPYFIQFLGKEVFDAWIGKIHNGEAASVPVGELLEKLDQDFFAARWARATDRQQAFMKVTATLENCEEEFSIQEIVIASKKWLKKPFSASHANQILLDLADKGLVFRTRRGGYSFAVPLMSRFIERQGWSGVDLQGGIK
ncbi:hypothetical protein KF728_20535 [Candidatus Obscuribacterales bacterium]|nr:hypothetical protein [Candidatus Obscuribacterales bacterium]